MAQENPTRRAKRVRRSRRRWTIGLRAIQSGDVLELAWLNFCSPSEAEHWIRARRGCYPQAEWIILPPGRLEGTRITLCARAVAWCRAIE